MHHAIGRAHHEQGDADGDDPALREVEAGERGLAAHRGGLPLLQAVVVAPRFELLVAEVLHRFVVEQTVDRAGIRARVELVHAAAELGAPLGDPDGERDVDQERPEGDDREADVVLPDQHARHERHLQQGREDAEQREAQQRLDAARSPLDVARHAAGLTFEVETQVERMQMAEHLQGDAPDRALRDLGEHQVAQFGEHRGGETQQPVGHEQCDRQGEDRVTAIERIDHPLHQQRYADVRELGRDQAHEGETRTPAEFPQVGEERPDGGPIAATCGSRGRRGCRGAVVVAAHAALYRAERRPGP